jgi:hypothetical protein
MYSTKPAPSCGRGVAVDLALVKAFLKAGVMTADGGREE